MMMNCWNWLNLCFELLVMSVLLFDPLKKSYHYYYVGLVVSSFLHSHPEPEASEVQKKQKQVGQMKHHHA